MTPKSEVMDYQIASSDFLRQLGEKQAASLEKRANPYIDKAKSFFGGLGQKAQGAAGGGAGGVKGWWNGMQPNTRNAIRNAGIGAGLAGLGGAALNYLNTDEDDERRNPLGAAVTGALGGAALGGLGTAGWNALKNSGNLSDKSKELVDQQALKEKAEKPFWKHLTDGPQKAVQRDPSTGLPSFSEQWRGGFEGLTGVTPRTAANAGAALVPAAIIGNDIRFNRNNRFTHGVENLLKNKNFAGKLPSGLVNQIQDPKFQQKIRRANLLGKSLQIQAGAPGRPSVALSPQDVNKLNRTIKSQSRIGNPSKHIRGWKGTTAKSVPAALATLLLPEAVDTFGGAYLDSLDSDHAARLLEARQRYQK